MHFLAPYVVAIVIVVRLELALRTNKKTPASRRVRRNLRALSGGRGVFVAGGLYNCLCARVLECVSTSVLVNVVAANQQASERDGTCSWRTLNAALCGQMPFGPIRVRPKLSGWLCGRDNVIVCTRLWHVRYPVGNQSIAQTTSNNDIAKSNRKSNSSNKNNCAAVRQGVKIFFRAGNFKTVLKLTSLNCVARVYATTLKRTGNHHRV